MYELLTLVSAGYIAGAAYVKRHHFTPYGLQAFMGPFAIIVGMGVIEALYQFGVL
jgi:hypothetical protein